MHKVEAHSIASLLRKNHVYLISLCDVLGALACWAVRQSPYTCPDNLDIVIKKASNLMKVDYRWERYADLYLSFFSFRELEQYLAETLEKIPEFVAWNSSKKGNPGVVIVTRYSSPDPDYDFIDLGALYRNVTGLVMSEAEDFRLFNEAFDRRHAYVQPDSRVSTLVSLSSVSKSWLDKCVKQKKARLSD